MEEEGSLRVLLSLTAGRVLVFQEEGGKPLPQAQQLFSTTAGTVAMSRLACGYKAVGSILHGRVGAGLTLTLDTAVSRGGVGPSAGHGGG